MCSSFLQFDWNRAFLLSFLVLLASVTAACVLLSSPWTNFWLTAAECTPLCLPMQTKEGKPAAGCTAREFCDVLDVIQEAAAQKMAAIPGGIQPQQLVWSFDNDRIHKAALPELQLRRMISGHTRAPLPPSSPDMHKVVEHCIGRLASMVAAELADTEDVQQSVAFWQAKVESMFFGNISAESIAKDVASLRDTYKAIIDVQGAWPAKRYR